MGKSLQASIVIPFHNSDHRIFGAIASCLTQTVSDIEVLLCDDGAPSSFLAELGEISDPRVRLLVDGENLGLAERINRSVSQIRSPFYFRMDADDLCVRNRVELQLQMLASNPSAMVVAGSCYVMDEDGAIIGARDAADGYIDRPSLASSSALVHPTVAFRASWLEDHPYDGGLRRTEDRFYWYDNFSNDTILTTSSRLLFYRARRKFGAHTLRTAAREEREQFIKRTEPGATRLKLISRSVLRERARIAAELLGAGGALRARTIRQLGDRERDLATTELRSMAVAAAVLRSKKRI